MLLNSEILAFTTTAAGNALVRAGYTAGMEPVSGIFITYRRDDSMGFAGRLEDDLSDRFGDAMIFRDREIPPGEDFATHLRDTLDSADIALAIIGPDWLDCRNADGQRRLDAPDDWVRLELETMLARGIPIVPVLVGGATMPPPQELPENLVEFSRRQAFPLSDLRWRSEVEELASRLAQLSPGLRHAFQERAHGRERVQPIDSLRQVADRVFAEITKRAPQSAPQRLTPRLVRWLAWRAKSLVKTTIVLGIAYILLREFGGPTLNSYFDRFIARTVDTVRTLTLPRP